MSSNNTTRLPPSMIASTYRRSIGTLHHPSSMPQISPISSPARTSPPRTSRGARIAREQLQLRGARGEGGELDDEPLHGSGGRRPLELRLERRRDALPRRGRVLQGRCNEPGGPVLELGVHAHDLHAPSTAARIPERAVDELVQCMGEQVAITDRSKKRQGG